MTTTKNNEHKKLNFSSEREQSQVCLNSAEHEKNQGRKVLNVPNLRFPEFQGEWKKCILGDITENFNLRNKDKIQYLMFSVTNDRGFVPQSEQFEGRDMVGEDIKAYKIIHTNDFAYNPARINVGSIAMYTGEKPCMISSLYVCFKTTKEVNNEWLMQLLKTPKMNYYYNVNGEGGVRVYLFYPNFARIRMSIPKIEEQKKIARLLNLIDERIATQNKIIDKLQSLIKGLNDSLYAQYGNEVKTSFANLGTSYSGLSGKSAQDFGSGKPFITYLNVYSNNIINENDFQYVAIKDGEKQNIVEYGDVLFTLSSETPNEVGIGSVFLGKEKVYLNSFCFGIHITNKEVAFPPYLSYYVSSTAFRKFIYPYAQGSTRFNLCKADFEKASIKLPTLENQKRIYLILGHIDCKIETERQLLALYNSQKQYLLRQMFI